MVGVDQVGLIVIHDISVENQPLLGQNPGRVGSATER